MLSSVRESAPAKVNLYLHVLGRRADGYHDLQSLVVFADIGDRVTASRSDRWSLAIDGPFGEPLAAEDAADNLVLRAAQRARAGSGERAALRLTKNLPVASGLGGGSADAAAVLRALRGLYGIDPGEPGAWADLGADIPVCLLGRPALVAGMGEKLTPLRSMPSLPAVLANPAEPSSTAAVFNALGGRFGKPLAEPLPTPADMRCPEALAEWLAQARNDLTRPAIETLPAIGEVLAALSSAPDALLARMSGSGATCFGLFPTVDAATEAASWLSARAPGWWIRRACLGPV